MPLPVALVSHIRPALSEYTLTSVKYTLDVSNSDARECVKLNAGERVLCRRA